MNKSQKDKIIFDADIGRVELVPKTPIPVMTYATWQITYTTGIKGLAEGGKIRIGIDIQQPGTPLPQVDLTDMPNYVSALRSDNGNSSVEPSGKVRHYAQIPNMTDNVAYVEITVKDTPLRKGDKIIVTYGDKTKGSIGFRSPRISIKKFPFWVLVDIEGTGDFIFLKDFPCVEIQGGTVDKLIGFCPSIADISEEIKVQLKAIDKQKNPSSTFQNKVEIKTFSNKQKKDVCFTAKDEGVKWLYASTPKKPGTYRIEARSGHLSGRSNLVICKDKPDYRLFWGDLHVHCNLGDGGSLSADDVYEHAKQVEALDFCAVSDHGYGLALLDNWQKAQEAVEKYYKPGEFVTILGWETMTAKWGHRNIYFSDTKEKMTLGDFQPGFPGLYKETEYMELKNPDITFSSTIEELWSFLKDKEALVIMHHCHPEDVDPPLFNEHLERLYEIHSKWGTSETGEFPTQNFNYGRGDGVRGALAKGHKLGFVGGSDCHYGHAGSQTKGSGSMIYPSGLTAVFAKKLTREAILEAHLNRRVYATTGARIFLDFRMDNHMMGSEYSTDSLPKTFLHVAGTEELNRIDIIRNGKRILSLPVEETDELVFNPIERNGKDLLEFMEDFEPMIPGKEYYFYVRVRQEDGHMAWSSPIWVKKL